jgi:single-strand DNA-binding protein
LGDIDSNSSSVNYQNVTDPLGWLIRPSATPRHYIDGISVLCRIITYDQAEAGRS